MNLSASWKSWVKLIVWKYDKWFLFWFSNALFHNYRINHPKFSQINVFHDIYRHFSHSMWYSAFPQCALSSCWEPPQTTEMHKASLQMAFCFPSQWKLNVGPYESLCHMLLYWENCPFTLSKKFNHNPLMKSSNIKLIQTQFVITFFPPGDSNPWSFPLSEIRLHHCATTKTYPGNLISAQ